MANGPELAALIHTLKKNGQAFLTVQLVSHPNDKRFKKKPPTCRVTVQVSDPIKHTVQSITSDLPSSGANGATFSHEFTIQVETAAANIFKSVFGGKRPLNIKVVGEPAPFWDKHYLRDDTVPEFEVKAGSVIARNIALIPNDCETDEMPATSTTVNKTTDG